MKRLSMMMVAACAMMMVSCASVESKAESYAQKFKEAKSTEEVSKLSDELDDYCKGLSAEEQLEFSRAFAKALPNMYEIMEKFQ